MKWKVLVAFGMVLFLANQLGVININFNLNHITRVEGGAIPSSLSNEKVNSLIQRFEVAVNSRDAKAVFEMVDNSAITTLTIEDVERAKKSYQELINSIAPIHNGRFVSYERLGQDDSGEYYSLYYDVQSGNNKNVVVKFKVQLSNEKVSVYGLTATF